jgi:hypothetical protein
MSNSSKKPWTNAIRLRANRVGPAQILKRRRRCRRRLTLRQRLEHLPQRRSDRKPLCLLQTGLRRALALPVPPSQRSGELHDHLQLPHLRAERRPKQDLHMEHRRSQWVLLQAHLHLLLLRQLRRLQWLHRSHIRRVLHRPLRRLKLLRNPQELHALQMVRVKGPHSPFLLVHRSRGRTLNVRRQRQQEAHQGIQNPLQEQLRLTF